VRHSTRQRNSGLTLIETTILLGLILMCVGGFAGKAVPAVSKALAAGGSVFDSAGNAGDTTGDTYCPDMDHSGKLRSRDYGLSDRSDDKW